MPASIRDALKRRGLRGKDLGRVEAAAGRALVDALVGVWHACAAALGEWKSANGFLERKSGARFKARERKKRNCRGTEDCVSGPNVRCAEVERIQG